MPHFYKLLKCEMRAREVENVAEECVNVKSYSRCVRDTLFWRVKRSIVLLEGSHASPAWPADKRRVKVKALERLETVA
jgi:hypothetical protein